jgi:peptide chain release factor 1
LLTIMEGDLDDVVNALQAYEAAEQLAALELGMA